MNSVGAVATLLNTFAKWVFGRGDYAAWRRRRDLAAKRMEVHDAMDRNDWDAVHRLTDELRELAAKH